MGAHVNAWVGGGNDKCMLHLVLNSFKTDTTWKIGSCMGRHC
jgi:hypothetical protein